ncbi:MAG: phage portal protein, partial [Pontiella sp.]|nr:phage portal protein [Pontiella sp.]
ILEANDMFHLKGPSYDGLIGYSVISYAARSIGLGMATESFGSDFFSNGAFPSIVLEHPGQIGPQAIDNLKNSVADAVSGKNKHAPIVFEEGIKASQWTIPPNDAQFIETRKFQVSEVARWFGVPLHKLQELDKSTFNNIEAQNIEFIQGALLSWIRRLELEANIKLVSSQSRSRVFSKMNMGALLRGDTEARGKYYRELSDLGVFSINDIRELEDMNPIGADGDKRLVQVNRTTIQKVGEDNLQGRIDGSNNNATAPAQVDESENGSTSTKRRAQNKEAESLADLVGAIVSRGTQRVNEALENKKTLSDFAAWLERFDPDQRRYIENKLCDQASSDWVDDYLQALKVKAVDCYNEGAEYSDDVDQVIAELIIR